MRSGWLLTEKLTELSSGQKQRVALAAAIACRPRILVLDEPTSNLDRAGSEGLVGILARLKEGGVAIVVSEHRLHRFLPVADQFVCMRSGRIAARWSAREFATLSNGDVAEFGLRHPGMRIERRDEPKADVLAWRFGGSDLPSTPPPSAGYGRSVLSFLLERSRLCAAGTERARRPSQKSWWARHVSRGAA